MKAFEITYTDYVEAETEEEAYVKILAYLRECVHFEDVTAFDFKEVKPVSEQQEK